MKRFLPLFGFLICLTLTAHATLRLPSLVNNNMVLQQDTQVNVWGWSTPHATVTVTPQWGKPVKAQAGSDGRWVLSLTTPAASFTPQTITIESGKETITLQNVLIGEVWVCSGQSNMEMYMKGYGGNPVQGYQDFVFESPRMDAVRHFTVAHATAQTPQEDVKGEWLPTSPQTIVDFGATSYLFGRELLLHLQVPIGIINTSWGGSVIEAWMDAPSQQQYNDLDLNTAFDEKIPPTMRPISIFNAMIVPLINYTIKGFCWYQGCSNTSRPYTYADKMVSLITLWRNLWKNSQLPFYYVELAPYYASGPNGFEYPLLREQQAMVMDRLDHVGMAPTNDLIAPYEAQNIHPSQKAQVARRLAAWALSCDYGYGENLRTIGPRYKSVTFEDGKALLEFTNVPQAFDFRGDPVGFEIAGEDGVFYAANASRRWYSSPQITVWSDQVPQPKAVRYCFRNFLIGNVFDNFGLPLTPFRTDQGPLQ